MSGDHRFLSAFRFLWSQNNAVTPQYAGCFRIDFRKAALRDDIMLAKLNIDRGKGARKKMRGGQILT